MKFADNSNHVIKNRELKSEQLTEGAFLRFSFFLHIRRLGGRKISMGNKWH